MTLRSPPDDVKGPMVVALLGRAISSPSSGTGDGIGTSKVELLAIPDGDAPLTSTRVAPVPAMSAFPRAAAAETIELGRSRVVR